MNLVANHRKSWILCLGLLAALGAGLILGRKYLTAQHETVIVQRSQLILKDGHLFESGQKTPFTGIMVEHYPNGSLQSRSEIKEGVLFGTSEGWHTNGQIQVREFFKDGLSHGRRTKWYPNGTRMSEAVIVNGKMNGPFIRWHENGTIAEQVEMQNDKPNGLAWSFYPSGFAKARAKLENGKVLTQTFWKDGEQKVQ